MKTILLFLATLSVPLSPILAQADEDDDLVRVSDLDFPRQTGNDQFVFFPVRTESTPSVKAGVVWFTRFFNVINEVRESIDNPSAVDIEFSVNTKGLDAKNGKYLEFFDDPNTFDLGMGRYWNPRPNSELCSFTKEMKSLINLRESKVYNSDMISRPCSGYLAVSKAKADKVKELLLADKGVRVNTPFQGCSKASPTVQYRDIVKELKAQRVVGDRRGNFFEIMWATYKMTETKPEIFGKYAKEASTEFLSRLYERSKHNMPDAQVDDPVVNDFYTDCKPKGYTFSYGD